MDPGKIMPSRLTMAQIREEAEEFRKGHIFSDSVPVDIEHIIEITKGICIVPVENLQKDCDMEGFISRDFSSVYVDKNHYVDDRYYNRVRFTIAHEIGHLVLHRSNIDMVKFASEDEWKSFRASFQDESLSWFESQASEFAGRLLVPIDHLIIAFKEARNEVIKKHSSWNSSKIEDDDLFTIVAPKIAPKFGVSTDVIEKRLRKENVMALIGK